jgi:hypothetical protein
VTSNHYQTLGVAPAAEDAVVRAAYRALMRLYHPDTNPDPEAQARVREITAAFFVLGDPDRRAAYDALPQGDGDLWLPQGPWADEAQRGAPPLRNLGLAAVALALGLSVTVAVWPVREPQTRISPTPARAAPPIVVHAPPRPTMPAPIAQPVEPEVDAVSDSPAEEIDPVPPPSAAIASAPSRLPRQPEPARVREVVQAPVERARAKPAVAPAQPRPAKRGAQVAARCASGKAMGGPACQNDRRQEVERIAVNFLKQSLTHADRPKQQLLLSAQVRSKAARDLCRSAECVSNAYLRQIRETTAIMEARTPRR